MIDNLIFGGICFMAGLFMGFFITVLLVSAKKYDTDDCEGYDDDDR